MFGQKDVYIKPRNIPSRSFGRSFTRSCNVKKKIQEMKYR